MNFNDVIHDALGNGGGTYRMTNYRGVTRFFAPEINYGFYVSEPRGIENLPYLDSNVVKQFIGVHRGAEYLGLWKDDFGNWSIDASTWVDDRTAALILGSLNNQRAVWDIANGSALNVVAELHPLLYNV